MIGWAKCQLVARTSVSLRLTATAREGKTDTTNETVPRQWPALNLSRTAIRALANRPSHRHANW